MRTKLYAGLAFLGTVLLTVDTTAGLFGRRRCVCCRPAVRACPTRTTMSAWTPQSQPAICINSASVALAACNSIAPLESVGFSAAPVVDATSEAPNWASESTPESVPAFPLAEPFESRSSARAASILEPATLEPATSSPRPQEPSSSGTPASPTARSAPNTSTSPSPSTPSIASDAGAPRETTARGDVSPQDAPLPDVPATRSPTSPFTSPQLGGDRYSPTPSPTIPPTSPSTSPLTPQAKYRSIDPREIFGDDARPQSGAPPGLDVPQADAPPRSDLPGEVEPIAPESNGPSKSAPPDEPSRNESSRNESSPDDASPDDASPDDASPDDASPDDSTPDDSTPDDVQPDDVQPNDVQPPSESVPPSEPPAVKDLFSESLPSEVLREPGGLTSSAERTWHDASGRHACKARLAQVAPDGVILLKSSGSRSTVTWQQLSRPDLAFLQRQVVAKLAVLAQQRRDGGERFIADRR